MQTEHLCDDVYYLTILVIFKESLVEINRDPFYHTINEFAKWHSTLFIVHTTTHFLHFTVHIFQKIMEHHCKNIFTDIFCVNIHTIFLWPYMFDANNKCSLAGELSNHLWIKLDIFVAQQYTLYPSLYMSHRVKI
jgi:hypothetical protein